MEADVLESVDEIAIRADAGDVRRASEWLESCCCNRDIPADQAYRLDLCLNEVLANIISHGGDTALASDVILSLTVDATDRGTTAALTISDAGKPFNPLTATSKPQARTLDEATPGGLGLSMIAKFSDSLDYRFSYNRNHLTISIHWTAVSS